MQRIVNLGAIVMMEMLTEIAIFSRVVASKGFSAAARELGLSTAAVSRHVTRLEQHLGGRLLQRTTRAQKLTELGEQVYAASLRMLDAAREIDAMASSYGDKPTGLLRVSAPIVFGQVWLAPRLQAFLDRYPEVSVQLTLVDRVVNLVDDGVDIAIRIASDLAPGLAARKLGEVRFVLVATPAYLQQSGTPSTPQALLAHRCCYPSDSHYGARLSMSRAGETVQLDLPTRITVNNSAATLAFIEAGGGIGLVPDFTAAGSLAKGTVQQVLPEWEFDDPYRASIHAVYTPGRHVAQKLRAFIDHLVSS